MELFDFDEAEASSGWLEEPRVHHNDHHSNDPNVVPRSEAHEYGVSSLHFAASNRPFHPQRLWAALEPLVDGTAPAAAPGSADGKGGPQTKEDESGGGGGGGSAAYGKLLRSKGVVWLASRSHVMGDWSQAGDDVHFDFGGEWPDDVSTNTPTSTTTAAAASSLGSSSSASSTLSSLTRNTEVKQIEKDQEEAHARSSLVLIGQDLDWPACKLALQAALLTDEEFAMGPAQWAKLEDPFPPWEIPE